MTIDPQPTPDPVTGPIADADPAARAQRKQRKQRRKRDRFGTQALVYGAAAVALSAVWWPYLLPVALLAGIGGIVLASLSRKAARRGRLDRSGRATAGLVLGIVAVALPAGSAVAAAASWDDGDGNALDECIDDADDAEEAVDCVVEHPELAATEGLAVTPG